MCKYNNYSCSYCPSGMADTLTCPEHQALLKASEKEMIKDLQEDAEDLEQEKPGA